MKTIFMLAFLVSSPAFAEMTLTIYTPSNSYQPSKEVTVTQVIGIGRGDDGQEPSILVTDGFGAFCRIPETVAKQSGFSLGELFLALNSMKSASTVDGSLTCWLAHEPEVGKSPFAKLFSISSRYPAPRR